ncbi:hypothetical protein PV08_08778 [Exophiala spinifera]|uniref:Transcription factor domain-containing protein n=1 Tax=Exophiala spinifera TaxID=91928 RepID=A0A0D2BQY7_9EURO|nr:uncharacterized protein PV08_08778 [Exophiala spinifera]KIW13589.1 hypothetical protein PV08_08778 [Exophiala spinifera]
MKADQRVATAIATASDVITATTLDKGFSNDQKLDLLLERLSRFEERITLLETWSSNTDGQTAGSWRYPDPPGAGRISPETQNVLTQIPPYQLEADDLQQGMTISRSHNATAHYSKRVSHFGDKAEGDILTVFDDDPKRARYVEKTPLECEELRSPILDILSETEPTKVSDVVPFVEDFLDHLFDLYPITCSDTVQRMVEIVKTDGFRDDISSCFVLLIVALSKAYRSNAPVHAGLADFQRASQILSRLSSQSSLEYVIVQVMSALFQLKMGRLVNFCITVHTACDALSTLIRRDRSTKTIRNQLDQNSIRRMYWICYNFEHEVLNEVDSSLPQSSLYLLEESLALPLGCDASPRSSMQVQIRDAFMFFLAEMSLRTTLARIIALPSVESNIDTPGASFDHNLGVAAEVSPLTRELRSQLDGWAARLPDCLGWSPEPGKGVSSPLARRLKLLYWFARFALYRPLILVAQQHPTLRLQNLEWSILHEGLLSALTLVRAFVTEDPDVDIFEGNKILSAIYAVKTMTWTHSLLAMFALNPDQILQQGIDSLRSKFADRSEWLLCKMYRMDLVNSS